MSEDSIDKSQFYDLMREIQNEVKTKVITKLLTQIQQQDKELAMYKKETKMLKNQLTYVLKRVILNKTDFNSSIKKNRINDVSSAIYKNNSMIINDRQSQRGSNKNILRPLRSCENYRCVTEDNILNGASAKKPEKTGSLTNLNGGNYDFNYNVDNKVSGYLNSLYRHNFVNNNNQFLNKKESIYDELFVNKGNNYINTEKNEDKNNNKIRANNSMDRRKNNVVKTKLKPINKYEYATYRGKGSVKKRINVNINNPNGGETGDKYSKMKLNTITNTSSTGVKRPKKGVRYVAKRSPFIANKF